MGISYKPLFKLLLERNMKKTDLITEVGLSSATLAKLSKGEPIAGASIEKLCTYFREQAVADNCVYKPGSGSCIVAPSYNLVFYAVCYNKLGRVIFHYTFFYLV